MITLDTNLYMLKDKLNITGKRLVEYTDKSVDEIVEAEAAQGNTKAASYGDKLFSNPADLLKMFKLADPKNKFRILSQMSSADLQSFLNVLEKEDLAIGLNFFTQDKLLKLLESIPKEQLVQVALEMFPPREIMKLMPDAQIDKFLQSSDLDKGMVLKHLKSLPPEMIASMIENATGQPVKGSNQGDLIKQLSQLPPDKYKDALTSMDPQIKRQFILGMASEDPKLFQLFDTDSYIGLLNKKQKPELVQAMGSIDQTQMMKMIEQLPQDLLAVVVSQIDPEIFADLLVNNFQDILAQIAAG